MSEVAWLGFDNREQEQKVREEQGENEGERRQARRDREREGNLRAALQGASANSNFRGGRQYYGGRGEAPPAQKTRDTLGDHQCAYWKELGHWKE